MADLESLDIRINASAGQAVSAIDALIKKFGALNTALHNFGADSEYVKGLNNLVGGLERLGEAVSAIDAQQVKDISSALGKLATNGDKLAKLSGKTFLSGVANESQKISVASEQARKKAEELAASYNFDMKGEGVGKLAAAIDKLQASAGNDQAIRDTKQEIESIITSYSRYENELHEVAKAENELIRNSHKKLNSDWQEQFGDAESAKRARGKLGIGSSSRQGASGESFITENESLGIQAAANETDNLSLALERLEQNEADAKNEFVGFYDVAESVSGGIQQVRSDIDELCASLNIATEKMGAFKNASAPANDDFMDLSGIDLDEEPWLQGDSASKVEQIAAAEEHAATAGQQMANAFQQVGQAGALFEPLVQGLTELSNVNFGDMTPLLQLKDVISKIGGVSGQNAAASLPVIAQGLQALEDKVPNVGPQLNELALGLRALGSGNITRAAETLPWISEGLRMLEGIKVTADVESISNLAYAVSRFGLANINKSIANMPALAEALRSLVSSLSTLPPVSENTISLLNALGGLNVNASSALRSMNGVSGGLRRYTGNARRAQKQSLSLAAAIGKMYANFFLLFRLIRKAGDAISLASQLKEVQNVVDVTFGDMADKMNAFSKEAVDTIGMAELTAKQIGSRFQAMGSAMGISPSLIRDTSEFVAVATDGYAQVSDSMADMSMNLTKLAGDMASFYNLDYEDVAEKLTAVFTGQTRPLRSFGIDLTVASMKAFALANGLNADVKEMTQAEKTMLRYQMVMAQTTAAQGDFQRTIMTWANQIRIAQERIKQLMNVLGQIGIYTFKPLVINFNNAMNRIIELATSTLNSLGKIFGWQIEWSDAGVLRDEADGLEDIADGYDDAGKSAKKFKNFLLGIDELNLLPDDKDGKGGGAGDLADLYGDFGDMTKNLNIKPIEGYFDSLYDTLFKLGKRIGEVELEWLKDIDWERVFDKARGFGEGLADFLNGYLSDADLFYEKGKFIANGINTIANAIDAFFKRFNGWQLGVDLGSMINGFTENLDWNVIRSAATEMAHDIAQTINGAFLTVKWDMVGSTIANGLNTAVDFLYTLGDEINWKVVGLSIADGINGVFRNFNFKKAASTLNKWAKGLLDAIITALKKTDWELIGRSIGDFIAGIDVAEVAGKVGKVFLEIFNAGVKLWIGMFDSAPIETALITALAIPFSNRMFRSNFGGIIHGFTTNIGSAISNDLFRVFNGNIARTFGNAFSASAFGLSSNMFDGWLDTNMLQSTASGFNAVSASLSSFTKIFGTIGVGFAEFFAIKDAVYDITKGTDSLAASIGQLVGAAGLAGGALSLLLGVPTGLIVAGATAGLAAIVGMDKALKELAEENVLSTLAKDMGDSYSTLGDINQSFAAITDDLTKGLDKLSRAHDQLEGLRSNLGDMVSNFSLIGEAAATGNKLTSDALKDLVGDISEVKKAWEDYIKAQYDYLIQSTVNNMNFIKSQRDLTEEEAAYFTNKINELTNAKYRDVEASQKLAAEADAAWKAYFNASKGGGVPSAVLDELYNKAVNASNALYGLAESTGVISDERIKEVNNSLLSLEEVTGKIHFPDLDSSSYEKALAEIEGYTTSFTEMYENAYSKIDSYKNDLISEGMNYDDVIMQTQAMYDEIDARAKTAMDSVQLSLYDKLYKFISKNDAAGANDFYNNVMVPYTEMIKEQYGAATDGLEPWLAEKGNELIQASFSSVYDHRDDFVGGRVVSTLSDNWRETFWQIRDSVLPYAEDAGEVTGNAYTDGVRKAAETTGNVVSGIGKTTSYSFGNVDRAMKGLNATSSVVRDSLIRMKDEFDKTSLKTDGMKGSLETLTSSFSTMKDKISNAKTFEGVKKSADEVVAGFTNIKDKGADAANVLVANLNSMTGQIRTAYDGISADTDVFMVKFNAEFARLFSADTWGSMITEIPNAFRKMWEGTMNVMRTMWNDFSKWVNQNAVIEIPKTKVGNTEIGGVNIRMKIPKYETGGFPEDGLFFANHSEMVGSFTNGQTAVANNTQIVEGIKQGVYEAMMSAMAVNPNGNVTVELNGDASTFFTAMVKENNNSIMRTGASPLRV